jgi:glutamate racemase
MAPNLENPIAVVDSGIGGMSTLSYISSTLPSENIIYVADSNYAPYGGKTDQEITMRMFKIFDFLLTKKIKLFVLACNTATAAAISNLRERYPYAIIGMEPAVKPASKITQNNEVGILATAGTLKSAKFAALLDTYSHEDINFHTQPCEGLVEFIENGDTSSKELKNLLIKYLNPLLKENIDTLILGCTHYWFIKDLIKEIIGDPIQIIDTNQAVANHVKNTLLELNNLNQNNSGRVEFWSNSKKSNNKEIMSKYWIVNNSKFNFMGNWEI